MRGSAAQRAQLQSNRPPEPPRPERWTRMSDKVLDGVLPVTRYMRQLPDGKLTVLISKDPHDRLFHVYLWHLSIAHERRYPTWDEIAQARYDLLPDNITMAMYLPPRAEYVNVHPNCFHLHEAY